MAKAGKKNIGGRPSKFKKEYIDQVYKLSLLGMIDREMADFFEISEATFHNWKKTKKGFLESIKKGKAIADGEVVQSLFNRATGYTCKDTHFSICDGVVTATEYDKHYPPETTAIIFWLKNRQPDKWRDKIDQNYTGAIEVNMYEKLTDEQLDEELKKAGIPTSLIASDPNKL